MSEQTSSPDDKATGERHDRSVAAGVRGYVVGLVLAAALTGASFYVLHRSCRSPVALVALAVAQMGVHLVFFLHITTGPDNTNNVLALAFGVLIVLLVMVGSLWIMAHLNHNLMSPDMMRAMQR
jgi:cytochrome o ubiquinol oxidase operon protein cyoD